MQRKVTENTGEQSHSRQGSQFQIELRMKAVTQDRLQVAKRKQHDEKSGLRATRIANTCKTSLHNGGESSFK